MTEEQVAQNRANREWAQKQREINSANELARINESSGIRTNFKPIEEPKPAEVPLPQIEITEKYTVRNKCQITCFSGIEAISGTTVLVSLDAIKPPGAGSTISRFGVAHAEKLRKYDCVICYTTSAKSEKPDACNTRFKDVIEAIAPQGKWALLCSKVATYAPPSVCFYRMALTFFVKKPQDAVIDIYALGKDGKHMIDNIKLFHNDCKRGLPNFKPIDNVEARMCAVVDTVQTGNYHFIDDITAATTEYKYFKNKTQWYKPLEEFKEVSIRDALIKIKNSHRDVNGFIICVVGERKVGKSYLGENIYERLLKSGFGKKFGVQYFDSPKSISELRTAVKSHSISGTSNMMRVANGGSVVNGTAVIVPVDKASARVSIRSIAQAAGMGVLFIKIKTTIAIQRRFNKLHRDTRWPRGCTVADNVISKLKTAETIRMDNCPGIDKVGTVNHPHYIISTKPTSDYKWWFDGR